MLYIQQCIVDLHEVEKEIIILLKTRKFLQMDILYVNYHCVVISYFPNSMYICIQSTI
jgi:hypothetical protein